MYVHIRVCVCVYILDPTDKQYKEYLIPFNKVGAVAKKTFSLNFWRLYWRIENSVLFLSPGPGPRSGLSSAQALLVCRCPDNVFLQRPAPVLLTANWWRWSWCAAASSFRWDRRDPRKTCRELRFKEHFNVSGMFFTVWIIRCEIDVWP